MISKFMIAVLCTSVVIIALLALAFYLGIRYHAWLVVGVGGKQELPLKEMNTNSPSGELPPTPLPEVVRTLPLPEQKKPSIQSPKSVIPSAFAQPKEIAIGESVKIGEVSALFSDVIYDGRCPADSDCVIAGEAMVEVVLRIEDINHTVYLSSLSGGKPLNYWEKIDFADYGSAETVSQLRKSQEITKATIYREGTEYRSSEAVIGGYTIHLESLTPGTYHSLDTVGVIPKEKYRATIVIVQRLL